MVIPAIVHESKRSCLALPVMPKRYRLQLSSAPTLCVTATNRSAFTLLELLLVLAILVAVSGMAMMSFTGTLENQRLRQSADQIRSEFAKARSEAMRTGRIQMFRYEQGGANYLVEPWAADTSVVELTADTRTPGQAGDAPVEDETDARNDERRERLNSFSTANTPSSANAVIGDETLLDGVTFHGAEIVVDRRATVVGEQMQRDGNGEDFSIVRPVLFYADGSTSDTRLILTNKRGYFIVIQLRGLTGVSRCSDLLSADEVSR